MLVVEVMIQAYPLRLARRSQFCDLSVVHDAGISLLLLCLFKEFSAASALDVVPVFLIGEAGDGGGLCHGARRVCVPCVVFTYLNLA